MSELSVRVTMLVLKLLSFMFDAFTFLPYFVCHLYGKIFVLRTLKAISVSGEPAGPWRALKSSSILSTSPFPGCSTVDDLFIHGMSPRMSSPCLGTRPLLKEEDEMQPDGSVLQKVVMGEYEWATYGSVFTRLCNFGKGLFTLGLEAGSMLAIYSETRADWMVAAQACFRYNLPMITLYSNMDQEGVIYGIISTSVTVMITSYDFLPKCDGVMGRLPSVRRLVVMNCKGRKPTIGSNGYGVTLYTMEEIERRGAISEDVTHQVNKPKQDDVAVIMYTSGSSGLPRGVVITHRNLMCGMSGQCERIPNLGKKPNDIYIGYLPLAHVLELTAELSCLAHGVPIGYASPLTLTDQSRKIKKGCFGDVSVLKPTMLTAVPAIMDRICKAVWKKVDSQGSVGRALFCFAYDYKKKWMEAGYDTPILNRLIFKKVRRLLGGEIRVMLSGGAPLSGETQRFFEVCFSCPVLQGYGLTETCGAGTISDETDCCLGRVGQPLTSCELRLKDWSDGGYTTSDKPFPRGEILVGGGNIALGYYNMEHATAENFTIIGETRYFCTGDVGQVEQDGVLRVIDKLRSFETPQRYFMCAEPWTTDSGLVTEALKLKRRMMDQYFSLEISRLYS